MKKLVLALSVSTLLLVSVSKAWAEDQVLTLYFLGTTLKSDAYLSNQSGWNRPELLATMFRENDQSAEMLQTQPFHPLFIGRWFPQIGAHSGRHHKYIINGAGTSPESNVFDLILQLLGTVDPDIGIRNWTNIRLEGLDAVDAVPDVGVHVVAFLGDTTGANGLSSLDASNVLRLEGVVGNVVELSVVHKAPAPGTDGTFLKF